PYELRILAIMMRPYGIIGKRIIERVWARRPAARSRRGTGGSGMARPRGARAHGPSRLGSIRTRRLRMRRAGNGSLHPPPPGTPARRASGVAHDPSRVWGAQDDVRGRHGPVPTAHRPLDRRGARRTLLPRAA